jgi:hypothetical protein
LIINYFASVYATEKASNPVLDLILSNVPVFNVDFIVNEGALFFGLFIAFLLLNEPRRIPFTLKSAAVFIFIRSMFITLTHLGPFPERSFIDQTSFLSPMNFGGDYFFSGHTGLPFLMALIFWDEKRNRYVSILVSIIFAGAVLLGHLHYSIDVFAAFFITYGIYHIARHLFPRDYKLFRKKSEEF